MSRDPIERGLEIEQAQLRGFARTVAEVEWLLLILVVLYLFIANPELARSAGVLGVLLGFAAVVLLFRYARPFARHTHFKLTLEVFALLAFLTAVLVETGRCSHGAAGSLRPCADAVRASGTGLRRGPFA
jgi:hypothetical protein